MAALAATVFCGPAWGATATIIKVTVPTENDSETIAAAALIAAPGEANRVRIAPGPTKTEVLIEDLGAVLTTGPGCVSVDLHHARCNSAEPELNKERETVVVRAGDLNDSIVASPGVAIDANGGSGADRLIGADGFDKLDGGGGAGDALAGLGGEDVLADGDAVDGAAVDFDALDGGPGNDTVSYATRTAAVVVDLSDAMPDGQAGEGDVLASIENVDGGGGEDSLTGSAGRDTLSGGPGRDIIGGGAGADKLDGASGADQIRGGAGADVVVGGKGDDRISLGDGDDVVDDRDQRAPTGRDQIACGTGRDRIAATQDKDVDKLARDCELFTAAENLADGNFVADVDAVTARLTGVRRSGSTILVAVKCERAKVAPACVISGELRPAGGGGALARPIARLRLKAGKQGTLRMRVTRAGQKRARRGRKVRMLIAERSSKKAPIEVLDPARAQAQVILR